VRGGGGVVVRLAPRQHRRSRRRRPRAVPPPLKGSAAGHLSAGLTGGADLTRPRGGAGGTGHERDAESARAGRS